MRRCTISDLLLVDQIMRDDSVYPFISDDYSPLAENFSAAPILQDKKSYILSPNDHSVFLFIPFVARAYWMHSCVLPGGRGRIAVEAAKECIDYIWRAGAVKILGTVAGNYPKAFAFAKKIGLKHTHTIKKTMFNGGALVDIHLFEKEVESCQPSQ